MSPDPTYPEQLQDRTHIEPWHRRVVPSFLRRERTAGQVLRFGIVGGLNTAVDFGVLNLLLHVFAVPLLAANTISYGCGIVNSFFWNKYWTFGAGRSGRAPVELAVFLGVSLSALALNDLVVYGLAALTGSTSVGAVNLHKALASAVSLSWNFVGYRFLAFQRPTKRDPS